MDKTRPQAVAGIFYPKKTENADELLKYFEEGNNYDYEYKTRAVIVPHAGWIYSGQLASEGIATLDKNVESVFIISPAHKVYIENYALSGFEKWQTPYGEIKVNEDICQELYHNFEGKFNDEAHKGEHAIEVQLPILQKYLGDFKIVPIVVGDCSPGLIKKIISHYYQNPKNAFIISTDLSHYYPDADAKKIDLASAMMIEKNEMEEFTSQQACGAIGIVGLSAFAKENNFSLIRVGMTNSAEKTGDLERVVGYGSWMLYEGEKIAFIKEYFSQYAKTVCKRSILTQLKNPKSDKFTARKLGHIPPVFEGYGACFVTLEIKGNLRGCVGSILAHQPLIDDLINNAYNAAFKDPRFAPLTTEEFEKTDISISLLSIPVQMEFIDEEALLAQMVPKKDGIIIKDGNYQAVYLPSVWEQLPEKRQFLNSLKQKAGLSPHYFSDTFEAYRFKTEYIT